MLLSSPAKFGRKFVSGTRRQWPRRDVGTSRDRDVETETTTLQQIDQVEVEHYRSNM